METRLEPMLFDESQNVLAYAGRNRTAGRDAAPGKSRAAEYIAALYIALRVRARRGSCAMRRSSARRPRRALKCILSTAAPASVDALAARRKQRA
jgi:hypothetical protein